MIRRTAGLSVNARRRLSAELEWIESWLADSHDLAGADRAAIQAERHELDETRTRLTAHLDELRSILDQSPTTPTTQLSSVVTPGVILEIRYDDTGDTDRVLVTCQRNPDEGITPVSPFSALGRALANAEVGSEVRYTHGGRTQAVKLLAIHDA
jgi:transcription elongation GreA/GreB family factor